MSSSPAGIGNPAPCPSMSAIEGRIKRMADSLSGALDCRWFPHPLAQPLPRLPRGNDLSLQERAMQTFKWIFALFNVPANARRVQPELFLREFQELHRQHGDLWKELVYAARAQRDTIAQEDDQDNFARRLEESERRVAYSHEVVFCAGMIWKHLVELLYLQCKDGGNVYDAAVPERMRISDQRVWDVRRMLADPAPLEDELGQKKPKDMQLVIEHLLARASHERYRKRGNMVYQQKCVDHAGARYPTSTWVPACFKPHRCKDESSMESFVLHYCKREHYPVIWEALVRCLPVKKIVDFMIVCDEPEFPTVYPQRHLLAFRNGIYDTCAATTGVFYEFGKSAHDSRGQAAAKFFDAILPEDVHLTCCKEHDGWWNIRTPLFQSACESMSSNPRLESRRARWSILDYQEWGARKDKTRADDETTGSQVQEDDESISAAQWAVIQLQREMEEVQKTLTCQLSELRLLPEFQVRDATECIAEYMRDMMTDLEGVIKKKLEERFGVRDEDDRPRVREVPASAPAANRDAPSCASRLPRSAQRFVYIFMGRMLHKLGLHDQWQIIPFLKGRGGSGKSTIAQVVQMFFDPTDVGILSNNSEKKFGLQPLLDKFIWLCLELKKNVQLDQAEFQSMVSGEDVSVAIKNQVAQAVKWSAPGLLCGNEAPSWIDAQGSIARRMAIITFPWSLQEKDVVPNLKEKILCSELPQLIVKCNVAYRTECNRYNKCDIWKILPPYFKEERLRFQKDTDAVYAAIYDEKMFELWSSIEDNPEERDAYYTPMSAVENHYRQKWRDLRANSFPEPFGSEKYHSAFAHASLAVLSGERLDPETKMPRWDTWVVGIRQLHTRAAP